jgi:hypothetical protein
MIPIMKNLFKGSNQCFNCENCYSNYFFDYLIKKLESENCYLNSLKYYLNLNFLVWILIFKFKFKNLVWSKNWYLNSKLLFQI